MGGKIRMQVGSKKESLTINGTTPAWSRAPGVRTGKLGMKSLDLLCSPNAHKTTMTFIPSQDNPMGSGSNKFCLAVLIPRAQLDHCGRHS